VRALDDYLGWRVLGPVPDARVHGPGHAERRHPARDWPAAVKLLLIGASVAVVACIALIVWAWWCSEPDPWDYEDLDGR
jgi:hypothetical protein